MKLIWMTLLLAAPLAAAPRDPALPDPRLTPGAVVKGIRARTLVRRGYATRARAVPWSLRARVYRAYGMDARHHPGYVIDHLAPLELGGSNDLRNLWPEPTGGEWSAAVKDRYEAYTAAQLARGKVTLRQAQARFRHDWIRHYKASFGVTAPIPLRGRR